MASAYLKEISFLFVQRKNRRELALALALESVKENQALLGSELD
jgi:hypothetical protein